jgi:hypothetical protein
MSVRVLRDGSCRVVTPLADVFDSAHGVDAVAKAADAFEVTSHNVCMLSLICSK